MDAEETKVVYWPLCQTNSHVSRWGPWYLSEEVDDVTYNCLEYGTFWSTKFCTSTKSGAEICSMHPNMQGLVDGTLVQVPHHLVASKALHPNWQCTRWLVEWNSSHIRIQTPKNKHGRWVWSLPTPRWIQSFQSRPMEAVSCMRACRRLVGGRSWAPNLPTFSLHFHLSFHPFYTKWYALIMINLQGKPPL